MRSYDTRRTLIKKFITFMAGFGLKGLGFTKGKEMKKIEHIITQGQKHWVGDGFHVQTMIHPSPGLYKFTNPFILLDYAQPKSFPPTEKRRGVGEHPHRGFETVTFAFEGEVEHRDSAGGGGVIKTGDVQWMTAASGLVHDEFHSTDFSKTGGLFEMVQLWVNLPKDKKMSSPRYQGVKNQDFPMIENEQTKIKVIAGEFEGKKGPCKTFTPINLYDIRQKSNDSMALTLKKDTNTLVLVRKGKVKIGNKTINQGELGILSKADEKLLMDLTKGSEILLLNGEPIDEPIVAYGPFVMNTKEEIAQAMEDYSNGKMGNL